MRYVCSIYDDGTVYLRKTTDDGREVVEVFKGHSPQPGEVLKRVSAFVEAACDSNDEGTRRLQKALSEIKSVVEKELGVQVA